MSYKVISVVGPTAVGKSDVAVKLAKLFNGEIINGDSVQVYKELDIGSAKITEEEMDGVKHHLLDYVNIGEEYSVKQFQEDARNKIEEISERGKLPVICGGTGLYIKALLYDYDFVEMETNHNEKQLLPIGTLLQHGKYRVEKHLASGGFGNTYIIVNTGFDRKFAMKEFFLQGINQRGKDSTTVTISNEVNGSTFLSQKNKFIKEAKRIIDLHNPYIVRVHDLFEETDIICSCSIGLKADRRKSPFSHVLNEQ